MVNHHLSSFGSHFMRLVGERRESEQGRITQVGVVEGDNRHIIRQLIAGKVQFFYQKISNDIIIAYNSSTGVERFLYYFFRKGVS